MQAIQNTVVFKASTPDALLADCLVSGNFVVSPGFKWPAEQSAGLRIQGAYSPQLINTEVVFTVGLTGAT